MGYGAIIALLSQSLFAIEAPQTFGTKIAKGDEYVPESAVIIQTTKSGDKMAEVDVNSIGSGDGSQSVTITIETSQGNQKQEIVGIGGSMTQASASVLRDVGEPYRSEVIKKYFHPTEGIGYTASRLCVGSSDFAETSFTYSQSPSDDLSDFNIDPDMDDVVPLIQDALKEANNDIKLLASPWTGPPWMKEGADFGKNGEGYYGGSLQSGYKDQYSLFIMKYIDSYAEQGIPMWAITPENEPVGNNSSWESMIFDAQSMAEFIDQSLGPMLEEQHPEVKMYVFDQNKDEMHHWANTIINHGNNKDYVDGVAIHWYSNTKYHYGTELEDMHHEFEGFPTFGTEHSIDGIKNPPNASINDGNFFNNDEWFWEVHVGGWGAAWATPKHEMVSALFRYARDIIVDLNNWTIGWIDWNFVLDKEGGPNHAGNYCLAPVMIDAGAKDVYYTPLFYTMGQFSKFIRPGARALEHTIEGRDGLFATPVINQDGRVAVVILNDKNDSFDYSINVGGKHIDGTIEGNAIQTVLIDPEGYGEDDSSSDEVSSSEEVSSSVIDESSSEAVSSSSESSSEEEESSSEEVSSSDEASSSSKETSGLFDQIQLTNVTGALITVPVGSQSLMIYNFLGQMVLSYDVGAFAGSTFQMPKNDLIKGYHLVVFE